MQKYFNYISKNIFIFTLNNNVKGEYLCTNKQNVLSQTIIQIFYFLLTQREYINFLIDQLIIQYYFLNHQILFKLNQIVLKNIFVSILVFKANILNWFQQIGKTILIMENRRFRNILISKQILEEQIISSKDTKSVCKLKQIYMSFEDSSKQLNDFITYIKGIDLSQGFHLDDFQKEQMQKIFVHFVEMFKRLVQKSENLEEENQELQNCIQQNNVLREQIQRLNDVIAELESIQQLCNEQQQKLRQSLLENSISKDKILQLQAFSRQLKNEKQQSVINYETYIENKSEQLQELNHKITEQALKLNELTKQLSQQKQRTYLSNKKLEEAHLQNYQLHEKIQKLEQEYEQLKGRQTGLQYALVTKLQHSMKSNSIRDDSSAIQERSHEDDHEHLKNVEKCYEDFYQNQLQSKQKGFKLVKKTSISKVQTKGKQKKVQFHRRNTMQQSLKLQKVQNNNKPNQTKKQLLKPVFIKSDKIDIGNRTDLKPNKKQILMGQMRSSGNSPKSVNLKIKNVLKSQINSKKPPSQQNNLSAIMKELQESKKLNCRLQQQNKVLQDRIHAKYDEISQLQGEIQMCDDNQKYLQQQLDECKAKLQASIRKEFQSQFAFKKYKQIQLEQKKENLTQKIKYQEYIYQLEEACAAFRQEIKIAEQQLQKRRWLCLKLKEQLKSLKEKIHMYEQALNKGLCPKIQDIFGRICKQQQQQVDHYQSPERILSRRSSPRNHKRALHTDRVKYENQNMQNSCQQSLKQQYHQNQKQQNEKGNQYLRIGLEKIKSLQMNKSNDFQSPKQSSQNEVKYQKSQENHPNKQMQKIEYNVGDDSYNEWPSLNLLKFNNNHIHQHEMQQDLYNDDLNQDNQSFFKVFQQKDDFKSKKLQFFGQLYDLNIQEQRERWFIQTESIEVETQTEKKQVFDSQIQTKIVKKIQAEMQTETIQRSDVEIQTKNNPIIQTEIQTEIISRFETEMQTEKNQVIEAEIQTKNVQRMQAKIQTEIISRFEAKIQTEKYQGIQTEMQTDTLTQNSIDVKPYQQIQTQTQLSSFSTKHHSSLLSTYQVYSVQLLIQSDNYSPNCYLTEKQIHYLTEKQILPLSLQQNPSQQKQVYEENYVKLLNSQSQTQYEKYFVQQGSSMQETQHQKHLIQKQQNILQLEYDQDNESVTRSPIKSVPLSPFNQNICNFKSQGASTQISPQQSRVENVQKNKICLERDKILEEKQADEDKKDTILRKSHLKNSKILSRPISQFQSRQQIIQSYIQFHTGKALKLTKRQQNVEFKEFKKFHKWDLQKTYQIQAERVQKKGTVADKLILWRKGLISIQSKLYLLSKGFSKTIKDSIMVIIGNSQIVIDGNIISTKICSRNYFQGNMGQKKWRIKSVTIYQ